MFQGLASKNMALDVIPMLKLAYEGKQAILSIIGEMNCCKGKASYISTSIDILASLPPSFYHNS